MVNLAIVCGCLAASWFGFRYWKKRQIASYFSSITGNKSGDFMRIINGERFESVFGVEPVDNRVDSVKNETNHD